MSASWELKSVLYSMTESEPSKDLSYYGLVLVLLWAGAISIKGNFLTRNPHPQ